MKLIHQHGDMLLYKVDHLPRDTLTRRASIKRHVLAEGEATGHAHAIEDLEGCDVYVDKSGVLYVDVYRPVQLTHEEHAAQTIQPGVYRVGRVREVDPFQDEIRAVRD